jgi:hypothetical protein
MACHISQSGRGFSHLLLLRVCFFVSYILSGTVVFSFFRVTLFPLLSSEFIIFKLEQIALNNQDTKNLGNYPQRKQRGLFTGNTTLRFVAADREFGYWLMLS